MINISVLSKYIYQISFIVVEKRISKHLEWRLYLNVIESDFENWNNTNAYKWKHEICLMTGDATFGITAWYKIETGNVLWNVIQMTGEEEQITKLYMMLPQK